MPLQLLYVSIFIFMLLLPTVFSIGPVSKPGCNETCGDLSIPHPFGVGLECSLDPFFAIDCNHSTNPPKPYLSFTQTEVVRIGKSYIRVKYPNLVSVCYDSLAGHGMNSATPVVSYYQNTTMNLTGSPYTLSSANLLTVIGCGDMSMLSNGNGTRGGCSAICEDKNYTVGFCPVSDTLVGNGCCHSSIFGEISFLGAQLIDLSGGLGRRRLFPCSYAFIDVDNRDTMFRYPLYYLQNSTALQNDNWASALRPPVVELNWLINGAGDCERAKLNSSSYACRADKSLCVDVDDFTGVYRCLCSDGYEGNPYLRGGCRDINECADNPCTSKAECTNTDGSFRCSCPKWYYGNGRKDGNGCIPKIIIFIGMGSGLGFILLLLMFFWLYKLFQKRKRKILKEKIFKRNGGMLLKQQANEVIIGKPKVFSVDELEVATDNFNKSRILGQGGQGTVFKGMLSNGKIVAIKKSKLVEENQLEQFINEVVILSQINHRNVVKLLGCCLETDVPLLVYEFMPNGTLFDLIHDPNNEFPFSWKMRLKIAVDIAGPLAYLHSASSMPIYHRDIKSSNILLDEKYVVKISDFGTSKTVSVDQTHLTTLVRGTFGYLDPEYFQSSQFTEKSDVYSFGVVLVELLTRQRPISLDRTDEDIGLAARFRTSMEENCLDMILDPQVLEQDKGEVILVANLARRCLNFQGKMRPTMKEVATELESLKSSEMEVVSKDEYEEVIHFDHIQPTSLGTEYTRTSSLSIATPSTSSDIHPLMFTT